MGKENLTHKCLTRLRRSAKLHIVELRTELLSTQEAAAILGKSVATVNRFAASDRLPVAKQIDGIRGARFYLRRDVEGLRDDLTEKSA